MTAPDALAQMAVESPFMLADIAVLDPELTYSVATAVTAATGVDALAHCVKSFTNIKAHPVIDGYATLGITLVGRYRACAVARAGLLVASDFGGLWLGLSSEHPIQAAARSGQRDHHSACSGVQCPCPPEKTDLIARLLGLTGSAEAVFDKSFACCPNLGIDFFLAHHRAGRQDLPLRADQAFANKRPIDNYPCPLAVSDILSIDTNAL